MILVATYQIWNGIFEEGLQFSVLRWPNLGCQLKSILTKQFLLNCFVRFIFLADCWCWNLIIFHIYLLCFVFAIKQSCGAWKGRGKGPFLLRFILLWSQTSWLWETIWLIKKYFHSRRNYFEFSIWETNRRRILVLFASKASHLYSSEQQS